MILRPELFPLALQNPLVVQSSFWNEKTSSSWLGARSAQTREPWHRLGTEQVSVAGPPRSLHPALSVSQRWAAPLPRQPRTSQAAAALRMRAEAGGEVEGAPGPAGRRRGSVCRRPSTRRSAPLPRHSAWNARGWKLSTSCVAASRVGQQKVPKRGEAMGQLRDAARVCQDPAGRPRSCAGRAEGGGHHVPWASPPPNPLVLAEKAPGLGGLCALCKGHEESRG